MNEVLKSIFSRRSIRKYSGQPISDEMVRDLLKAGMSAPSAHNQRPWHFVVIKNRDTLNQITRFHPYSSMLKEAALAILVCGDKKLFKTEIYWDQDCAAATENILLAAHGLGLGAVWLGIYPKEVLVKSMLKLVGAPDGIMPFSLISLGYPAEEQAAGDRFDEKRVHLDQW
ncbi:nitroreductase family protein [Candidatus Formimonas warabiya]|uniref:nitroreductase family protein n=1 Tax=Formimonas warabiya TaxID=1761012 RepID=UPI0011D05E63|nr:nitroreductase family protein [Candidatus Formimonas warabiya]